MDNAGEETLDLQAASVTTTNDVSGTVPPVDVTGENVAATASTSLDSSFATDDAGSNTVSVNRHVDNHDHDGRESNNVHQQPQPQQRRLTNRKRKPIRKLMDDVERLEVKKRILRMENAALRQHKHQQQQQQQSEEGHMTIDASEIATLNSKASAPSKSSPSLSSSLQLSLDLKNAASTTTTTILQPTKFEMGHGMTEPLSSSSLLATDVMTKKSKKRGVVDVSHVSALAKAAVRRAKAAEQKAKQVASTSNRKNISKDKVTSNTNRDKLALSKKQSKPVNQDRATSNSKKVASNVKGSKKPAPKANGSKRPSAADRQGIKSVQSAAAAKSDKKAALAVASTGASRGQKRKLPPSTSSNNNSSGHSNKRPTLSTAAAPAHQQQSSSTKTDTSKASKSAAAAVATNRKDPPGKSSSFVSSVNNNNNNNNTQHSTTTTTTTAMDLYERHRREWERIWMRLEKLDRFGYFWDPAPAEYQEYYDAAKMSSNSNNDDSNNKQMSMDMMTTNSIGYSDRGPIATITTNVTADAEKNNMGRYSVRRRGRRHHSAAAVATTHSNLVATAISTNFTSSSQYTTPNLDQIHVHSVLSTAPDGHHGSSSGGGGDGCESAYHEHDVMVADPDVSVSDKNEDNDADHHCLDHNNDCADNRNDTDRLHNGRKQQQQQSQQQQDNGRLVGASSVLEAAQVLSVHEETQQHVEIAVAVSAVKVMAAEGEGLDRQQASNELDGTINERQQEEANAEPVMEEHPVETTALGTCMAVSPIATTEREEAYQPLQDSRADHPMHWQEIFTSTSTDQTDQRDKIIAKEKKQCDVNSGTAVNWPLLPHGNSLGDNGNINPINVHFLSTTSPLPDRRDNDKRCQSASSADISDQGYGAGRLNSAGTDNATCEFLPIQDNNEPIRNSNAHDSADETLSVGKESTANSKDDKMQNISAPARDVDLVIATAASIDSMNGYGAKREISSPTEPLEASNLENIEDLLVPQRDDSTDAIHATQAFSDQSVLEKVYESQGFDDSVHLQGGPEPASNQRDCGDALFERDPNAPDQNANPSLIDASHKLNLLLKSERRAGTIVWDDGEFRHPVLESPCVPNVDKTEDRPAPHVDQSRFLNSAFEESRESDTFTEIVGDNASSSFPDVIMEKGIRADVIKSRDDGGTSMVLSEGGSEPVNDQALDQPLEPHLAGDQISEAQYQTTTIKEQCKVKPQLLARFPNHPPYNWDIIKRRCSQGRYVLDREHLEEEERFRSLRPYFRNLPKNRVPKRKFRKSRTEVPTSAIPTPKKGSGGKNGKTEKDEEIVNPRVQHTRGVNWDLFTKDIVGMCDLAIERDTGESAGCPGSLSHTARKVKDNVLQAYEKTGKRHMAEMLAADDVHKYYLAVNSRDNTEAAMQKWRKDPYPERKYERLSHDVVCAGLSQVDEHIASYELKTNLPDSFVGMSYRYDDTGQSEAWMKTVVESSLSSSKTSQEEKAALALASDDGVIRAQVVATMQSLLINVQDRVLSERQVLHEPEWRSINWVADTPEKSRSNEKATLRSESDIPEIVEQPVWGIDCYTRRNVSLVLEVDFDPETALVFIEKWLLPAINACPVEIAHDIANAARLLEGLSFDVRKKRKRIQNPDGTCPPTDTLFETPLSRALGRKIKSAGPPWLKVAAQQLRRARAAIGPDFFRVHPKGHGSVLLSSVVAANRLVTFYRGELHPSWRWGEKMDAIALTQQRKNLKPALPDFYNMALERPQKDPRGYGLLFVDASRKGGHGSSLSHSCDPTCEVRVAAVNGEYCLAMTTLRELEMGEELTFNYNAVTESLEEYRSAVCLCGYGRCRGSFLHFATADCYQQVLNRNAPIATRFSSLVRGCIKKVMSEDDERILRNHGFGTASFGALSVNRHGASGAREENELVDTMDVVPVWLRTFVADTLRYIEYERRALPIALICNHISTTKKEMEESTSNEMDVDKASEIDPALPKEPKLQKAYFFFTKTQVEFITDMMRKDGILDSLVGIHRMQAMQKYASSYWQTLDEEKKSYWRKQAHADYAKKREAWLERVQAYQEQKTKAGAIESVVSFHDADAEGIAAMEQRIQQLTQALSRVGRVLDRHRERVFNASASKSDAFLLKSLVHSPIDVLPDVEVVKWMWCDDRGPVKTLFTCLKAAPFVRPLLLQRLSEVKQKYESLESSAVASRAGKKSDKGAIRGTIRETLTNGILDLRSVLLEELRDMQRQFKEYKVMSRCGMTKKDREKLTWQASEDAGKATPEEQHSGDNEPSDASDPTALRQLVGSILSNMIDEVERRVSEQEKMRQDEEMMKFEASNPWIQSYSDRFVLAVVADALLFYAHTKTFFRMKPYSSLVSTPIEVYARELGNEVPVSAIDNNCAHALPFEGKTLQPEKHPGKPHKRGVRKETSQTLEMLCKPDDIVAGVSIEYSGDYVFSQLLQWYNGGIGQKPGIPDMLGCTLLPPIEGCFDSVLRCSNKNKPDRRSLYETQTRPRLVEWLKDPHQRGNPWPDDVRNAFVGKGGESSWYQPFGCPVVDFLATGDETSLFAVLEELGEEEINVANKSQDGILSTVDRGRPAQAISNWVQCENPDCMKWRKIPWYVDVDLLPEKFYCKDNTWNPDGNDCSNEEDDWDEGDALVDDGMIEDSPIKVEHERRFSVLDEKAYRIGARFDVLRNGKYVVAVVRKTDFSGKIKRIMFHYPKMNSKFDEWIPFGSPRIFLLHSQSLKSKDESEKEYPPTQTGPTLASKKPELPAQEKPEQIKLILKSSTKKKKRAAEDGKSDSGENKLTAKRTSQTRNQLPAGAKKATRLDLKSERQTLELAPSCEDSSKFREIEAGKRLESLTAERVEGAKEALQYVKDSPCVEASSKLNVDDVLMLTEGGATDAVQTNQLVDDSSFCLDMPARVDGQHKQDQSFRVAYNVSPPSVEPKSAKGSNESSVSVNEPLSVRIEADLVAIVENATPAFESNPRTLNECYTDDKTNRARNNESSPKWRNPQKHPKQLKKSSPSFNAQGRLGQSLTSHEEIEPLTRQHLFPPFSGPYASSEIPNRVPATGSSIPSGVTSMAFGPMVHSAYGPWLQSDRIPWQHEQHLSPHVGIPRQVMGRGGGDRFVSVAEYDGVANGHGNFSGVRPYPTYFRPFFPQGPNHQNQGRGTR